MWIVVLIIGTVLLMTLPVPGRYQLLDRTADQLVFLITELLERKIVGPNNIPFRIYRYYA